VHVAHVSTAESVDVIRWAKAQGIAVTAEVTPHHLALGTDLLAGYDPVFKVNPPLRPDRGPGGPDRGPVDGTIDAVATDHAPHARHDKEHAFPDAAFGMLGLETAFAVVARPGSSPTAACRGRPRPVMSVAPAAIAGPGRPRPPDRRGRAGQPRARRPHSLVTVDRDSSQSLSRNNPVARRQPHRRRPHDDPARSRHRARRSAHLMLTTREPAVLVLEDGRTFTGRAYGHRGRRSVRPSSPPA
jgi:dihydroorotase